MRNFLITAALALGLAACADGPGPVAPTLAPAVGPQRDLTGSCGEASCVPITEAYISHFTGAGCSGTESYYTAYNGYDGVRRSWDGGGIAGTTLRTVTNRSYKYGGVCYDAWPSGNTLSDFVTVYRGSSNGICGEASCEPVTEAYISHFTGAGCTGTESYYTAYNGYDGIRRSWDGQGVVGTTLRTVTNRSYKYGGVCYDAWPSGNTLSDFVTVYRGPAGPVCGEASCVPITQAYISHFTGAACTGTESYYTAYNGYDGIRRSWDGGGIAGTTLRTVTNRSYKYGGVCYDAWPSGNTLSNFVTVYR
jgi:hypothetical protein